MSRKRMNKKEPLYVGQTVWLEKTHSFADGQLKEEPKELIVLEANKTSAYIWYDDKSTARYMVNQKTHQVNYSILDGNAYRLWLSKEDYYEHIARVQERKELLEKARKMISQMTSEELRTFVRQNKVNHKK